jgi:potassium-transporting ATPase ATP-binding subunit
VTRGALTTLSNVVMLVGLTPLALNGINFRPLGATEILARNLFTYGLGGIVLPFVGIKLIDIIIVTIGPA